MDLVELGRLDDYFTRCAIKHTVYPDTYMINCYDTNEVIHSYYGSTQTAVFRKSNDKNAEKRTVKNMPPNKFAYACKHPEALQW